MTPTSNAAEKITIENLLATNICSSWFTTAKFCNRHASETLLHLISPRDHSTLHATLCCSELGGYILLKVYRPACKPSSLNILSDVHTLPWLHSILRKPKLIELTCVPASWRRRQRQTLAARCRPRGQWYSRP